MHYPGFLKDHFIHLIAEYIATHAEIRNIFLKNHRLKKQQHEELCQEIFHFKVSKKMVCRIKSVIQKNPQKLLKVIVSIFKILFRFFGFLPAVIL